MRRGFPLLIGLACAALSSALAGPVQDSGAVSQKSFAPLADSSAEFGTKDIDLAIPTDRDSDRWSFALEPYIWAMGASGQVGVKGLPPSQIDYTAKTVLQHLDWGIMSKGEVRNGRWGLLADGLFAQLSVAGNLPAPLYSNTAITLQQGMATLALAYRVIDDRRGFLDVYAGARYNYMGFNLTASTDSAGIANFSETASQRILEGIGTQADAFLTHNGNALAGQVADSVRHGLTARVLEGIADFPGDVDRGDLIRIIRQLQNHSGAYRELIAAAAKARVAAAKNQLTPALQNAVTQARQKFAKALARNIENGLPTSAQGAQWWVDPIIGLRAQIDLTHWLFLAAQGDVGGFCAGSTIAWNVQASLGINFTRNIYAELGYRYLYMDYSNDGLLYRAAEFGLFAGIGARF